MKNFARSGSPLSGEIVIVLPKDVSEAERGCVERLHGIWVKWLNWLGEEDEAVAADMFVQGIRFLGLRWSVLPAMRLVAVGIPVSRYPPHRSGLAR